MTAVLVPWRPTPDRQPAWDMLRRRWQALGYEPIEGTCPDGPWVKALAVEDALARTDDDVLVVADADVWCDETAAAIAAVAQGSPWGVPHARILRRAAEGNSLERPPHAAVPGGGITVIHRGAYLACPMPRLPRREDEVWGVALTKQFGRPWRGLADLIHYWHEPAGGSDG